MSASGDLSYGGIICNEKDFQLKVFTGFGFITTPMFDVELKMDCDPHVNLDPLTGSPYLISETWAIDAADKILISGANF